MSMQRRVLNKVKAVVHERTAPPAPKSTKGPSTPAPKARPLVDYEGAWDKYATTWRDRFPSATHIGDEWQGTEAGAAANIEEYERLIRDKFVGPYVESGDRVLELGVGGGRTAKMLREQGAEVACADIAGNMLAATRDRLGDDGYSYYKLDGKGWAGVPEASFDVFFCFDTFVHVEPRDIFNYLADLPPLMRGRRLALIHHGNVLTERGWGRFVKEYKHNLGGRSGSAFAVMTDSIMERFLDHLGYEVILKDETTVPRDCVWVVRVPEPTSPA